MEQGETSVVESQSALLGGRRGAAHPQLAAHRAAIARLALRLTCRECGRVLFECRQREANASPQTTGALVRQAAMAHARGACDPDHLELARVEVEPPKRR